MTPTELRDRLRGPIRDMAAVLRGEEENDYPPAHELAVHEAILCASGYSVS